MLKSFDRLSQRLRDPLLTVLTLMLSFLLFVLGPMQAARLVTGQHFGYFFGLVLVPAAFLYSRNLFVVGPIAVMTLSSRGLATVSLAGPSAKWLHVSLRSAYWGIADQICSR